MNILQLINQIKISNEIWKVIKNTLHIKILECLFNWIFFSIYLFIMSFHIILQLFPIFSDVSEWKECTLCSYFYTTWGSYILTTHIALCPKTLLILSKFFHDSLQLLYSLFTLRIKLFYIPIKSIVVTVMLKTRHYVLCNSKKPIITGW